MIKEEDLREIKVIIFDFDDTIYNASCWGNWESYVKNMINKILGSSQKAEEFLNKYHISCKTNGQQIATALIKETGSAKKMIEYLEDNIYDIWVKGIKHLKNEDFKKLSSKYKLYILSNSPRKYLIYYLEKMGISTDLFKEIYQNDFLPSDPTKQVVYKKIISQEKIQPYEAVMIGDSYTNDIVPAICLGLKGVWVNTLDDVKVAIKMLEKI